MSRSLSRHAQMISRLRWCAATAVSLTVFIGGLKGIYNIDAAAINGHGWLYDMSDRLYRAAIGHPLFPGPDWDLQSVYLLGASVWLFSICSLMLLAIGTCLLSGFIRGGAAWTEAKARVVETTAMAWSPSTLTRDS